MLTVWQGSAVTRIVEVTAKAEDDVGRVSSLGRAIGRGRVISLIATPAPLNSTLCP